MSTCHTRLRRPWAECALGCPPWEQPHTGASAASLGLAGLWGPLTLFGVLLWSFRGALSWQNYGVLAVHAQGPPAPTCTPRHGVPLCQGPPWQCQLGGGEDGLRCRQARGRGGGAAIISAVTHVLITENGLISLRLEAA